MSFYEMNSLKVKMTINDGTKMYGRKFPHLSDDNKFTHVTLSDEDKRRPHEINSQPEKFIAGFYMNDNSICDGLIEWYKENPEKEPGVFGQRQLNKERKDSIECGFTIDNQDKRIVAYHRELQAALKNFFPLYPETNMTTPWSLRGMTTNLQYYPPGGGYKVNHFERDCVESAKRFLVFMTYLNDVPDGGTHWKYQNVTLQAEKGLTVFWPTDWTHIHRGVISEKHEKYIATGWYSFDD